MANDTGGGLVLASLGDPSLETSRIARLVLTNCDSYEHVPPGSFAQIVKLCRLSSAVGGGVARQLVERGERVRVLLRRSSSTAAIDDEALRDAMDGCDNGSSSPAASSRSR